MLVTKEAQTQTSTDVTPITRVPSLNVTTPPNTVPPAVAFSESTNVMACGLLSGGRIGP